MEKIAKYEERKKEIIENVLYLINELKSEKKKPIEMRGEIVSLKCGYIENDYLGDGKILNKDDWQEFVEL